MSAVRVKICGITRPQDLEAAIAAGADAVGFVFVPGSPRFIQAEVARSLCRQVPAFVCRVGLFLDQEAEYVRKILHHVPLNLLQFHGTEDEQYCDQFDSPYIKAISMDEQDPVAAAEKKYTNAAGILLDSHEPGGLGGTGKSVDWDRARAGRMPLILAGGLNPSNVAAAIKVVRPWAVDVSSGVESAPGIKDAMKIRKFVKEAKIEE